MKSRLRKWICPALFVAGGMLLGLAYYYFVGCTTGNCSIAAHPVNAMLYMGLVGWLISGIFKKRSEDRCST